MTRALIAMVAMAVSVGAAGAQSPGDPPIQVIAQGNQQPARSLAHVSREEYARQTSLLESVVANCRAAASACDSSKAGEDARVDAGAGAAGFDARREWLRDALEEAKKQKYPERAELMAKVSARLTADAAEASGGQQPEISVQDARAKADAVLSHTEFRAVTQQSYLQQELAIFFLWLSGLFEGAGRHLPHSPWLVLAIEWGVLAAAAAGLLIWAWRTTRQQRVALTGPSQEWNAMWQKESDDWARRAEAEGARGQWREAVHCLYWAAIVMLEGKKMWRANRARTPREYLPLLEAGSARQKALGGLTQVFERIWYGLRDASRGDFERAQALLEELKAD